jgi:hypothetical protein
MSPEKQNVLTNFNREEAEEFCRFFAGTNPITIQTFDHKKQDKSLSKIIEGPFPEIYQQLVELNIRGAGIFLMVNEGDGKGRCAENIISIRSFFLDLDGAPLDPVRSAPILPHIIVESSPGRYQSFWKISPLTISNGNFRTGKTIFESVQKGLAARFGGDTVCCDPSRVMRIPGFYHQKKEPFLSRMVEINNNPSIHPKEFIKSFDITITVPPNLEPTNEQTGQAEDKIYDLASMRLGIEAAEFCLKNKNAGRHKQALRLGYECRREGLPEEYAVQAATFFDGLVRETNSDGIHESLGFNEIEDAVLNAYKDEAVVNSSDEPVSLSCLLDKELPPPNWIIEGFLPEGVTILAGDPKVGKSYLTMNINLAVATGEKALDHYSCQQGIVLHLDLEGNPRLFSSRLKTMLDGRAAPESAYVKYEGWARGATAATQIEKWIGQHPDTRLVIIDTLQMVRDTNGGRKTIYSYDYDAIAPFRDVAAQNGIGIVLVHHTNKSKDEQAMYRISGTNALPGAADTLMVLERRPNQRYAFLSISGRSIEQTEIGLEFTGTGNWVWKDATELRLSSARKEILELLRDAGPMGPTQIKIELNKPYSTIATLLRKMIAAGQVRKVGTGSYTKYEMAD